MTPLPDFIDVLSAAKGSDAYITGRMAMYLHGMIRARPGSVEIASRTKGLRPFRLSDASCRLIHLPATLATGATRWSYPDGRSFLVATAEKAVFDWAFDSARTSPWQRPSISIGIPEGFDRALFDEWVTLVMDPRVRSCLTRGLQRVLARALEGPPPERRAPRKLPSSDEAIVLLTQNGAPALSVREAALLLRQPPDATGRVLARLAADGVALNVARNVWAIRTPVDPMVLAPYVVSKDAYVSGRSALHYHGLIRRPPPSIEVVTALSRSQKIYSNIGAYQAQQVDAAVHGGFKEVSTRDGQEIRMATPEKALFDIAYLACRPWPSRASVTWSTPPRMEGAEGYRWVKRVADPVLRLRVQRLWERLAGLPAHSPVSGLRVSTPVAPQEDEGGSAAANRVADLLRERLRKVLINIAADCDTVPFKRLPSLIAGDASDEPPMATVTKLLDAIVETEVAAGRPMLPVIVRTAGRGGPPSGVLRNAKAIGWLSEDLSEGDFVDLETQAVWGYWSSATQHSSPDH